jgi:hypothetical protein
MRESYLFSESIGKSMKIVAAKMCLPSSYRVSVKTGVCQRQDVSETGGDSYENATELITHFQWTASADPTPCTLHAPPGDLQPGHSGPRPSPFPLFLGGKWLTRPAPSGIVLACKTEGQHRPGADGSGSRSDPGGLPEDHAVYAS